MKNTQINKAVKQYEQTADQNVKQALENIFGKKLFVPKKKKEPKSIMDRAQSWADVLKINKEAKHFPYPKARTKRQKYFNQLHKIDCIIETLNEGEELSFANEDQKKWWLWIRWDEQKAGFVFFDSVYFYTNAFAGLGPRLCLKNEELLKHFWKYFESEIDCLMKFS